ncbi:MAG: hypothetical protein IJT57_04250, partial [Selenomonadaceae bacterium]|nr:hypothetical protein [Selenomonadaceae bacterium]
MDDKNLTAQLSELKEKLREWKKIQIEKEKRKMAEDKDKKPSVWSGYSDEDKAAMENLAAGYIDFLSRCKTERESVVESVKQAEAVGYKNLDDVIKSGVQLKAGDKVYSVFMKKTLALFQIGTEPLENG